MILKYVNVNEPNICPQKLTTIYNPFCIFIIIRYRPYTKRYILVLKVIRSLHYYKRRYL